METEFAQPEWSEWLAELGCKRPIEMNVEEYQIYRVWKEQVEAHEAEGLRRDTAVKNNLQQAREAATQRYLGVAAALKVEAGIVHYHIVRGALCGGAWPREKRILAPEGRTRRQLNILAHECAHVVLNHSGRAKPKYVKELEAEQWAHAALRRHGIAVPRAMTQRAKDYVAHKIEKARRAGAKHIDPAAVQFAKGGDPRAIWDGSR